MGTSCWGTSGPCSGSECSMLPARRPEGPLWWASPSSCHQGELCCQHRGCHCSHLPPGQRGTAGLSHFGGGASDSSWSSGSTRPPSSPVTPQIPASKAAFCVKHSPGWVKQPQLCLWQHAAPSGRARLPPTSPSGLSLTPGPQRWAALKTPGPFPALWPQGSYKSGGAGPSGNPVTWPAAGRPQSQASLGTWGALG